MWCWATKVAMHSQLPRFLVSNLFTHESTSSAAVTGWAIFVACNLVS